MTEYPKLAKAIEYLVDNFGPIRGYHRLLRLIYLADKCWSQTHGTPYTEATYILGNNGPHSEEYFRAIHWLKGIEIAEKGDKRYAEGYVYESGFDSRLKKQILDPEFQNLLDELGTQWEKKSSREMLDYFYSDSEIQTKGLADTLLN